MTILIQALVLLSATSTYSVPYKPVETRSLELTVPRSELPSDSSRKWAVPLYPDDRRRKCSSLIKRALPGFGSIGVSLGCVSLDVERPGVD